MKRLIAGATALLILAGAAAPAFAQDHRDQRNNHNHGRMVAQNRHYAPPPRARFREGQVWHGHHVTYRGGHWGYYQPHNGANLFINIPL